MDTQNVYQAPQGQLVEDNQTYEPKIFSTQGRIGRLRYLAYSAGVSFAIAFIGMFFVGLLAALIQSQLAALAAIPIYIAAFASSLIFCKRRLNDLDRTGWLALLMLVPFVNIIFGLYVTFARGSEQINKYGPPPAANKRGIIWVALIIPIVALIGILAAIALPAYQQYVQKAHAAQQSVAP